MFNKFIRESYRLWDVVGKYSRVGQAADMAHARYMLDT